LKRQVAASRPPGLSCLNPSSCCFVLFVVRRFFFGPICIYSGRPVWLIIQRFFKMIFLSACFYLYLSILNPKITARKQRGNSQEKQPEAVSGQWSLVRYIFDIDRRAKRPPRRTGKARSKTGQPKLYPCIFLCGERLLPVYQELEPNGDLFFKDRDCRRPDDMEAGRSARIQRFFTTKEFPGAKRQGETATRCGNQMRQREAVTRSGKGCQLDYLPTKSTKNTK
jgi:hypothetical protein